MPTKAEAVAKEQRPRRRLRAADRRARITQAALRAFAERGYEATAMEDIAAGSGVSRPVLYDHFRSKKHLFMWLIEQQRDVLLEHIMARIDETDTPEARVRIAVGSFFDYVEQHPETWQVLFHDVVGDPEVFEKQRQIQGEANHLMAEHLLGGGQLRELGDELGERAELLAQLWGAGLKGLARWWFEHPDVPKETLVTAVMATFWLGLGRMNEDPASVTSLHRV